MAVAPGRGSGATGKGALEAKGRCSPPAATSSRPVSCLPPPARPGSLQPWAPASPRPRLGRSLSFFFRRPPTPPPPFREMSSLEGGFSPSSAPLGAGTVLGRAGKRASRAGRARVAPPAPEGDRLPGAGAGEGARARDARRHGSRKGPPSGRCPAPGGVPRGTGHAVRSVPASRSLDQRSVPSAYKTPVCLCQTCSLASCCLSVLLSLCLSLSLSFPMDTPLEGA